MGLEDIAVRHLRALVTVAEEGSFGGAADALGVSQAAISQQVATLEKALGERLFDRPGGPRAVTLTPAGRLLLGHAEAVLERLNLAERELDELIAGSGGRLVIGTYQSVSVQLLPELVRDMREVAPNLDIHLVERDHNDDLIAELLDGSVDITFLAGPASDHRLDMVHLGTDPFVVVLPQGSEYARMGTGRAFPTMALNELPLVGQHPCDCQDSIDDGLRAKGVRGRYVFRSNDNGAVQGMVRAGMGPAVMPLLAVDTHDSGVVIKDLDPPIDPRTILLATRKGTTLSRVTTEFIDLTRRTCRARLGKPRRTPSAVPATAGPVRRA